MSESVKSSQTSAKPGRLRRGVLALVIVPVCAIAPWFVPWPWQNDDTGATTSPASSSSPVAPTRPKPATSAPAAQPPSDAAVKALQQQISTLGNSYDLPVPAEVAGVKTTPGAYEKVGRIQIPAVGLDVSYGEGVYAAALDRGPGHWPGTPLPGEAGNSVLSGHRNTHTQPFKQLDELKPGDKILVSADGGELVTFHVDRTTIVPEAKFKDFVLRQPADPETRQVTLFACHPEGNPIFRIVVQAHA
jgi:LPXTG-site transpeptidase (sortase) family protein